MVPETFHGPQEYHNKNTERFIYNNQERLKYDMGQMLQESFGWQNPVYGNNLHHRLEIEAFPMEKWLEFKEKFLVEILHRAEINREKLINALEQLESFGKPAGAAKE
jgi:hypothetical protein